MRGAWWKRSWTVGVLGVVLSLVLGGCLSPETKRQVILSEIAALRFVDLMQTRRTTREEEQRFIVESLKAWTALREALDLTNPIVEGEAAPKFKRMQASATGALRDLAWAWLYFKVWHPDFDVSDRRPLAAVGEGGGDGSR